MLRSNKKAISEVVGYTMLIIMALALSVLVYSFLKVYIPKEKLECTEDINLIVADYECSVQNQNLMLIISNKGLFKADAAYIRLGAEGKKIKTQINSEDVHLYGPNQEYGLNPEQSFSSSYDISSIVSSSGIYELEIQPAVIEDNRLILCEKALITQPISCT